MKRSFVLILSLVMSFMLAACGGNEGASSEGGSESGEDKKVIGVSLQNITEFRTYMIEAMEEEQENHPDFEFIYSNAENDSAKQMNQIENFIARGVDAIILTPVDTVAAVDILAKVNEAGIPIIVANQTFDGVDKASAYVGSESIEAGILQMEEVAERLGGKGNIAIMEGQMGHEAQIMRTEGNKQIIEQNPDMEIVFQGTGNWNRDEGMTLMENWIQSGKEIDAVVANNDEMAIGAILALEAAGKLDEVLVAGVDATPAALQFMKDGKLSVTVFQDARGQGIESIRTAVKAANGEEVETMMVPFQLVVPEQVDDYIAKYE
ncbi:sugar ABC transporter substrate-binding protein [Halalkalibacter alkaliphilus]|uniref:Sugar ABC transporter substrate-binding protein n=1 Tax=Halalkalibacter alkaliphilus TaxID=2917993 RepID=A0A9X1ZVU2_9BACI|nr:sugar ABC transporter substrate-binding protein [Halalkalibacter alkaliphilus]MCL7745578.1 sugar ABC transporter substrate-binding protein [Halalkalibacter alkaliphilus]